MRDNRFQTRRETQLYVAFAGKNFLKSVSCDETTRRADHKPHFHCIGLTRVDWLMTFAPSINKDTHL